MKLGCRYAVSGLFSVLGLVLGLSGACAQPQPQPLDHAPEGRRMPGWLVDGIAFQGQSKTPKLNDRFGLRGDQSTPISSALSDYVYFGPDTTYYGRAFLKINEPGIYTFVLSGEISGKGRDDSRCDLILRIGDIDAVSALIKSKDSYFPSVGNLVLSPGYYQIAYVIACRMVKEAKYNIMIRGPNDMKARYFFPDELFYISR